MSAIKQHSRVVRYNPNLQRAAAAAVAASSSGESGADSAGVGTGEEPPADWLALASLLLGVLGLLMRYKIAAWLSVFTCFSSIATMKRKDVDWKQVVCSLLFSIMGCVMNYFGMKGEGTANERMATGGLPALFG